MMWLGLVVGALVGAAVGDFKGAVILGFLGWLAGLIVGSLRDRERKAVAAPVAEPVGQRIDRLERAVAGLEARLARMEAGATPVAPRAEPSAPVPTIAEPTMAEPAATAPHAPSPAETAPMFVPAPTPPAAAPQPAVPNPLVAWLTGGNAIARIGLLILFFGLAFLLKYAADRDLLPVEFRVAGVALAGIALLAGGWRLRERRAGYALGLQGAGVAVLYLTTFAALRLYHLLPPEAAFFLLAAIAVLSAFIAIAQDAPVLAAFGAGGGFLAPILASTGGGSHVMLFGYYLLLNVGILGIALFKAWRGLNVMGFLFTFFIGLAWGVRYYRPEHFATTEPFLVAFFALYVAVAVLFARREAPRLRHYVDATLVFGTPLAAFGLQAALTRDMEFALAYSSVAASAFYLALAAILHRARGQWTLLVEAFLALGVVFATLAIPLALDARWTSAAWALEGAAIVWFGIRQDRRLARAFGLALEFAAAIAYGLAYPRLVATVPLVDAAFVGGLLLAGAGMWTARLLDRAAPRLRPGEAELAPFAFLWGIGWWLFAALHEIDAFVAFELRLNAHIALLAATALASSALSLRLRWPIAAWPALALLPALALSLVAVAVDQSHPFAHDGALAWLGAVAVELWVLRRHAEEAPHAYADVLHAGTALLVAALGALELHWLAVEYTARGTAWSVAAAMVVPAFILLAIASHGAEARWPLAQRARAYRTGAAVPLLTALALWSLYANVTHDGRSDPLPYLPIVNALDLGHVLAGAALVALWAAWRRRPGDFPAPVSERAAIVAAGALAFVWLNGILLRSIHHWAAIPYAIEPMARSVLVQAALSIFWSVLALTLMVGATRSARRALWMLGAGLMAVVVVKLFIVDLSHVGGIERIVSFIGVGLLMLAVGYFAPVPPRIAEPRP